MAFKACTDSCTQDFSVTYSDGDTRTAKGNSAGGIEWLYINATTERVVLQLKVHGDGTAQLYSQWDCSEACQEDQSCFPTIMYPSMVPTAARRRLLRPIQPWKPTKTPTVKPTPRATSAPAAPPTSMPTVRNVRRSATTDDDDCATSVPTVLGSLLSLILGAFIGFGLLWGFQKHRKKESGKVTPIVSGRSDGDGDDGSGNEMRSPEMTPMKEGRSSISILQVAKLKGFAHKAADQLREKARERVREIQLKNEEEMQQLEEERKTKQLEEILEPPFDDDVTEHGMVQELAELLQLHVREQEALLALYDGKREAAVRTSTSGTRRK